MENAVLNKKNRLFAQGLLLTFVSFLVALFSFLKESVFARYFGLSYVSDAYTMAIQVPEVLFALVWETVNAVIIPLYSKALHGSGKQAAKKFYSNVLTIICLLSLVFVILGVFLGKFILMLLYPGVSGQTLLLATKLLRWVFPVLFFEGIIRVISGILNVHEQFAIPKILSSVRNLGVIVFLFFFAKEFGVWAAVFGLLTGIVIESVLNILLCRRCESYSPTLDLRDPSLKAILLMTLPLLLGIGAVEINAIADKAIASFLDEGSISSLNYASKLSGVIKVTLLQNVVVLLYPRFSRLAAEEKKESLVAEYVKSINVCFLIGIPVFFGGFFLKDEIVSIAFEGGAFDRQNVLFVSALFAVYLANTVFWSVRGVSVKLFTACYDTKTPTVNSVIGVAINIVLNLLWVYWLGALGLALATLVSTVVMCVRLLFLAKKKIYTFSFKPIIIAVAKSIFAGLGMFAGLWATRLFLSTLWLPDSLIEKAGYSALCVILGGAIYGFLLLVLKTDELGFVLGLLKKKKR